MNARRILWFSLVSANLLQTAVGQSFVNLGFEQATAAQTGSSDPAVLLPGWTLGNTVNGGQTLVSYQGITLGAPAASIWGPLPDAYFFPEGPLQGSYSALLQYHNIPSLGLPTLSQTGLVPADARSISFLVDNTFKNFTSAAVTLSGVPIPLVQIPGGRLAGDVSAFAGSTAVLMFSNSTVRTDPNNYLYFDDIQFSSSAVPEPSTFALLGIGGIFLYRRRKS